jgi:6-phosphogluconolactonase
VARVEVVAPERLADTAAERLTELTEQAIAARGRADVSLTGGKTPKAMYEALADPDRPWRSRIDWPRVHLYWGDERHVPPDHRDSNFGMANRALIQHVPIRSANVHRIRAELADAADAADQYAHELPAIFDVMLLGLGADCHIASIFPGSPLLEGLRDGRTMKVRSADPAVARVAAVFDNRDEPDLDGPAMTRITVTPSVILESRSIVMLVSGRKKARAVASAIDGALNVDDCPGQLLREAGDRVEWIVDRDARSG